MRSFWQKLVQLDLWLEQYRLTIFLLSLVVVFRIPSFFEPYWYGDEGIYLVIGEALNRGQTLYTEIIDHKTPLIYIFAQVGTQFNFRLLMLAWLVASTALLIQISKQLFTHTRSWVLTVLTFIFVVSVPSFEGTIPNGELFVIGFVLLGVYFLLKTSAMGKKPKQFVAGQDLAWLLAAGSSFGLAILTKVPAVLDLVAWMLVLGFAQYPKPGAILTTLRKKLASTVFMQGALLIGVMTPILLSVLYFLLIGQAKAYLDYGLLYNFRYAGTWQPTFPHQIFSSIFSLPGKTLIMGLGILSTWIFHTRIPKYWSITLMWMWTTLFASLLSNRPYPHYFLQILPPLALLIGSAHELLVVHISKLSKTLVTGLVTPLLISLVGVVFLLAVRPYPIIGYYQNWWRYITNASTLEAYNQWFNPLMRDNYAAAKIIRAQGNGELFIWGTNPMLYALSGTIPTGRFTVSFHIHDFAAYAETIADLLETKPPFIVVMYDESGELPGLNELLFTEYRLYRNFERYQLWKLNATK